MTEALSVLDVQREIREACARAGSQAAWAAQIGVSPQHLCDVMNARRDPGPAILGALGLIRRVTYERRRG